MRTKLALAPAAVTISITTITMDLKMKYEVRLDKKTLQQCRDFIDQFFASLPTGIHKQGRIPGGTLELLQGLINNVESDWVREATYFGELYGSINCFDNRLLIPLSRLTIAVELGSRCSNIVTYGNSYKSQDVVPWQEQFDEQATHLLKVICRIAEGLQKRDLKNPRNDKEKEILLVRKYRLRYASHLANLAMTIRQHYFLNAAQGEKALALHAQVQRNLAAVLIDCARVNEGQPSILPPWAADSTFHPNYQALQEALNTAKLYPGDETMRILIAAGLALADQVKVAGNPLLYHRLKRCLPYELMDRVRAGACLKIHPERAAGLEFEKDLKDFVRSLHDDEL